MFKLQLLLLLVLTNVLCYSQDVSKKVDSLEDLSVVQYNNKQYKKLFKTIDEILKLLPCSKRHMNNGMILADQVKDTVMAMKYAKAMVDCNEDDAASNTIYGFYLTVKKKPAEGLVYTRKAFELLPDDISVRVNLAHCLWLTGDKELAREVYEASILITATEERLKIGLMADLNLLIRIYPKAGFSTLKKELEVFAAKSFKDYSKGNELQESYTSVINAEEFGSELEKYRPYLERIIETENKYQRKRGEFIANAHVLLGKNYYVTSDFEHALYHYKTAAEYYGQMDYFVKRSEALSNTALVFDYMGLYDSSYTYHVASVEAAQRSESGAALASATISVGQYLNELGENELALQAYNKALPVLERLNNYESLTDLYYSIGNIYANTLERIDSSLHFYNKAQSLGKLYKISDKLPKIYYGLARVAIHHGQYREALSYLMKTYTDGGYEYDLENPVEHIELLHGIGFVHAKLNQYDSAIIFLEKGAAKSLNLRRQLSERAKREYHSKMIGVFETLSACYLAINDKNKSMQAIEKSRNMVLAEKMNMDPEELFSIDSIRNVMRNDQLYIVYGNMNSDGRIDTKALISFSKENISAATLTDSAFIFDAAKHSYGAKLDTVIKEIIRYRKEKIQDQLIGKELRLFTMIYRNALADAAGQKRSTIISKSVDTDSYVPGRFAAPLSQLFYRQFFQPVEHLAEGKKELIVMTDGDLNFVPFESMMTEEGKYLGELYTIKYLPSLKVSKGLLKRPVHDSLKILSFGDPAYQDLSAEAKAMTPIREYYNGIGAGWNRLPATAAEVDSITNIFPGSANFKGEDANEMFFKIFGIENGDKKFSVLHFATHGYVANDDPRFSALVLSQTEDDAEDGYVTAAEIEQLRLNVDLVVLSACQTGLGMVKSGEGVMGLVNSFLVAGARSIIASMWSVSDDATSKFMINMYKEVKEQGVDFKQAMQNTRIKFIRGDFGTEYKKPFYWAPFVYYGN